MLQVFDLRYIVLDGFYYVFMCAAIAWALIASSFLCYDEALLKVNVNSHHANATHSPPRTFPHSKNKVHCLPSKIRTFQTGIVTNCDVMQKSLRCLKNLSSLQLVISTHYRVHYLFGRQLATCNSPCAYTITEEIKSFIALWLH